MKLWKLQSKLMLSRIACERKEPRKGQMWDPEESRAEQLMLDYWMRESEPSEQRRCSQQQHPGTNQSLTLT